MATATDGGAKASATAPATTPGTATAITTTARREAATTPAQFMVLKLI